LLAFVGLSPTPPLPLTKGLVCLFVALPSRAGRLSEPATTVHRVRRKCIANTLKAKHKEEKMQNNKIAKKLSTDKMNESLIAVNRA